MPVIFIEIGNMPSLLRSIVRSALEEQGDFAITEMSPDERLNSRDRIDVVIVSEDREGIGPLPVASLANNGSPRIVTIAADGHSASIVRVTSENRRIEAAVDLSNVVRTAALERRRALH